MINTEADTPLSNHFRAATVAKAAHIQNNRGCNGNISSFVKNDDRSSVRDTIASKHLLPQLLFHRPTAAH